MSIQGEKRYLRFHEDLMQEGKSWDFQWIGFHHVKVKQEGDIKRVFQINEIASVGGKKDSDSWMSRFVSCTPTQRCTLEAPAMTQGTGKCMKARG